MFYPALLNKNTLSPAPQDSLVPSTKAPPVKLTGKLTGLVHRTKNLLLLRKRKDTPCALASAIEGAALKNIKKLLTTGQLLRAEAEVKEMSNGVDDLVDKAKAFKLLALAWRERGGSDSSDSVDDQLERLNALLFQARYDGCECKQNYAQGVEAIYNSTCVALKG